MKLLISIIGIIISHVGFSQSNFPEFLHGTWKMENKEIFERWDLLNENSLKGFSYSFENGQMRVLEYFDISRTKENVVYSATVLGQNNGKSIEFIQTGFGNAIVFENPNHDSPKKIVYNKISDNELFVEVLGAEGEGFSYKTRKEVDLSSEQDSNISNPNFDEQLAKKLGADDYGMKSYILVMLKTGTNQSTDSDFIKASFRGHLDNINRLANEGLLVVAGPLGRNQKAYRGIFILNVTSIEKAEALLQTDPAIREGLLDAEIYNWYGSAALPMYLDYSEKIWKQKP